MNDNTADCFDLFICQNRGCVIFIIIVILLLKGGYNFYDVAKHTQEMVDHEWK